MRFPTADKVINYLENLGSRLFDARRETYLGISEVVIKVHSVSTTLQGPGLGRYEGMYLTIKPTSSGISVGLQARQNQSVVDQSILCPFYAIRLPLQPWVRRNGIDEEIIWRISRLRGAKGSATMLLE
jgi:hypothetical protein